MGNKKESSFKNMVATLFVVTLVAGFALGGVYNATKKPIARANKLKTETAALSSALKTKQKDIENLRREMDGIKVENSAMKTAISLLRSRQAANVGETVTAKPIPATMIEGQTYIFMGETATAIT